MADYSQIPACFYRIGVKALITDEDGRFLLFREEDGRWEFPGGGLEYGEDHRGAIERELREEAGLEVIEIAHHPSYFMTTRSTKEGFYMANIFYTTRVYNLNIISSNDCLEVRFFTPEEALKMDIFPNVIEFCKIYKI